MTGVSGWRADLQGSWLGGLVFDWGCPGVGAGKEERNQLPESGCISSQEGMIGKTPHLGHFHRPGLSQVI